MTIKQSDQIRIFLKGIETGDPAAVAVVNEAKYIQHNPHTSEGNEGLAVLFKRLSKTSPKVTMLRSFDDGDFVFAHMEYDFSSVKIGFEVFRFEEGQAVEHWDNIQPKRGPNISGHSMIDGQFETTDLALTEENREFARAFVTEVLINRQHGALENYIDDGNFTQHNPETADGLPAYRTALNVVFEEGFRITYNHLHRVLAEGNFALCVSEGFLKGVHTSFYDLFRIFERRIVEHWDTIETVPPREEWLNENGKF